MNNNIKTPWSIKIFIGYLIFLILLSIIALFQDFIYETLLFGITLSIIAYGFIKRTYWIWVFSVVYYLFVILSKLYSYMTYAWNLTAFDPVSLIAHIFTNYFAILFHIATNFINFLLMFLPPIFLLLYVISVKSYFKNIKTGNFEKIMSVFLIIAILLNIVSVYGVLG